MNYNTIAVGLAKLCDGGNPNDFTFTTFRGPVQPFTNESEFYVQDAIVENRSASTVHCGVGVRKLLGKWKAGQMSAADVYTDDTTDAQSAATGDFPLETLTANDGSAFFCTDQFNLLCFLIGTAAVGANWVRKLQYTIAGGTWQDAGANTMLVDVPAGALPATGELLLWWDIWPDWAPSEAGHGTGVPVGYYGVRWVATTTHTTAAVASSMSVCRIGEYKRSVLTLASLVQNPSDKGVNIGQGECVVTAITVVHGSNRVEMRVRAAG